MWAILALTIAVAGGGALAQECTPIMPDSEKRDCFPWPGATRADCEARGCVWCPAPAGTSWCYYNDRVCPSDIPEAQRTDCMPEGGDKNRCTSVHGCLWCVTATPGVPWCFPDPDRSLGGESCPLSIPTAERIDCHPEPGASKDTCLGRGCYWCETGGAGPPFCFMPTQVGYKMIGDPIATTKGWRVDLQRVDTPSLFGNDVEFIRLELEFQTADRLRIKFYDPGASRFEVPGQIPSPAGQAPNPKYDVIFESLPVFALKVVRKSTSRVIFDTSMGGLVFSDQYMQVSIKLDGDAVYGFGEQEHHTLKHDMNFQRWGMYARDQAVTTSNLYGTIPFYMNLESGNNANGLLFLNANGQDVTLMPAPGLTYRTIGGVLDMYLFLGPGPDQVVQQYNMAVGKPVMIPYWSLGFQLCRWGYTNIGDMQAAVNRMRQYNIPHDVQYGDIDYMDGKRDFTVDSVNFAGLKEYVTELKAEGTRFVIILDPAISYTTPDYPPFEEGNVLDVWVKDSAGAPVKGEVWPGPTYYPDYTNPSTEVWWREECRKFMTQIDYAGLWIDMNEPSSFIDGQEGGCSDNNLNNPPYIPYIADYSMWKKTLCMDSQQFLGSHYNLHSLYGWSMAKQSLPAARAATGKRSVVFSRSTFPGAGQYGQHWLGDNFSRWSNLRWSVISMMEFNMFGFPYNGADICGFNDPTTEELCSRWQQLGAFYPFSRNHNAVDMPAQDPGIWPAVAAVTRAALLIRYELLPHLYTLFHQAHNQGSSVVRPLFFEFPNDPLTHEVMDQFLWGAAFMVAPVLDQGTISVDVYFPQARWFSWHDGLEETVTGTVTVSAPLDFIPLFVRGGYVLPLQKPANSTMFSRDNNMGLLIALDAIGAAAGSLIWDDGDSIDTYEGGQYFEAAYTVSANTLTATVVTNGYAGISSLKVNYARIFGPNTITELRINGLVHAGWAQNGATKEILVNNMEIIANDAFTMSWS